MNSCEHAIDIIIQSPKDIDKLKDIKSHIELLYINTILTSMQLKYICDILKPKHIIFRQDSNKTKTNIRGILYDRVVITIPFDASTGNTIFPSSVNKMTFYWNHNRPLTKNIYPLWIYEMYNNIFHNIESLNKLSITKSHIKSKSSKRINSNKTTKRIHK
jgi:hypothetical protein